MSYILHHSPMLLYDICISYIFDVLPIRDNQDPRRMSRSRSSSALSIVLKACNVILHLLPR